MANPKVTPPREDEKPSTSTPWSPYERDANPAPAREPYEEDSIDCVDDEAGCTRCRTPEALAD